MAIELESERRKTVLRRMCKLAAVVLIVAIATLIVGILAVVFSNGKFPFNAAGGTCIIAGIMASLMSICPMCMLFQAYRFEKYGKSSYDGCSRALSCCGFLTILGIVIGFAFNGVVFGCYHSSKETGCWRSKDSQFALAILAVILTSILLILISTIFIICCCNCMLVGYIDSTDYTFRNGTTDNTRAQRGIYRVYNDHQTPGFSVIPSSRFTENSRNSSDMPIGRHITAPTAPPISWDSTNIEYPGEDANETINSGLTPDEYDRAAFTQRYDDPPPSYYEVMSRDPMETPL